VWDGRDAWLLQAIVYAGRRGDLSAVIGRADSLNVAIVTREELELSVPRLEAAALVQTDGERIRSTRAGRRLVRRSSGWRGGLREITPRLEVALKERVPFPAEVSAWTLGDDAWRRAYERYVGSYSR
jgi:hypothetical protein